MGEDDFVEYRRHNDNQVSALRDEVRAHISLELARDTEQAGRIIVLQEQVKILSDKVDELIDLWNQAKGAVAFMKIMAALVAGGAAAWAWIMANLHITPKG
jgi:hypothetical protein